MEGYGTTLLHTIPDYHEQTKHVRQENHALQAISSKSLLQFKQRWTEEVRTFIGR
jgi:hypothetical protein